jgi:hypothetical protein
LFTLPAPGSHPFFVAVRTIDAAGNISALGDVVHIAGAGLRGR